jgi:hypothetical protein
LFFGKYLSEFRECADKYLSVYGEHDKLGLFAIHEKVFEYAESI